MNKHTNFHNNPKKEVEAAILKMKDAIIKGDFVDIVLNEKVFIRYINLIFPYHEKETERRTMRRGSFFWLKELYNAIRERDKVAMKRAYTEFVRLYVLMEAVDTTTTAEEKKNEYIEDLTNGEPSAYSLTPDFFHELEFNKIDAEVTKYKTKSNDNKQRSSEDTPGKNLAMAKMNTNEITPEKMDDVESESYERMNDKKIVRKNELIIEMNGWDSVKTNNRLRNEITLEQNDHGDKRENKNKTLSVKKRLNIDMNGWNEHSNNLRSNKRKHI